MYWGNWYRWAEAPNITWQLSKTGQRKLHFCTVAHFINHGFIRFFLGATTMPFQDVTSLMLTSSEMILNVSSENHVHPAVCGCRNTVQMSASGVNIALHLASRFVPSQWNDAYLWNTYQVQALHSLRGVVQGLSCSRLFAAVPAFGRAILQSSRLPARIWTGWFNRIKFPLPEPDPCGAVSLCVTFI